MVYSAFTYTKNYTLSVAKRRQKFYSEMWWIVYWIVRMFCVGKKIISYIRIYLNII